MLFLSVASCSSVDRNHLTYGSNQEWIISPSHIYRRILPGVNLLSTPMDSSIIRLSRLNEYKPSFLPSIKRWRSSSSTREANHRNFRPGRISSFQRHLYYQGVRRPGKRNIRSILLLENSGNPWKP
ncbi:hypothetical protein GE061_003971 [Apolygus lucorum]|uniref:Uncharacterized protein n=1 Tax=Apolygus lucorum TaxID=248454 RepID=A0A8S9WZD3_APOLU|nr:hypothetical protein GE061_003971 [Apolygus lucorum]